MATATILSPGETLGGYRIDGIIGFGGMAIVYRAEQISLGRHVALKVLAPELSSDEAFRERFRREGKHAAALDHPHVVTVYDSGDADGRLYLALRLVDGTTLAERMRTTGLSADETISVLTPVASALDAAHATGLVHRDVKPQNILLDRSARAYLADFGVAKGIAGTAGLTANGAFVGSVNYASPEQIRGEPANAASDMYALAAVLYECFTGTVPYPRETDAGVMHAHLNDPPPTLPPLAPAAARLDEVIARGMAKDPRARYHEAEEMLSEAGAAVAQLPRGRRQAVPSFARPATDVNRSAAARQHPAPAPTPLADAPARGGLRPRRSSIGHAHPGFADGASVAERPSKGTEILSLRARGARGLDDDGTTADRRREPATAAEEGQARGRPRFRRLVFWVIGFGAVVVVAAAVVITSGGAAAPVRTRSGPLDLTYSSPWRATAVTSGSAFALSRPVISLTRGTVQLAAGVLKESAAVPAGPPPELTARFGRPTGTATVRIAHYTGMRYEWRHADGHSLAAFVIATGASDVAVTCSNPILDAAADKSCAAVAASTKLVGVQVLSPGPSAVVTHALVRDLAPVSGARSHLKGLAASSLSARAAPAKSIADVEREAVIELGHLVAPERNEVALTTLSNALNQEASGFLALDRAADRSDRTAYVAARSTLISASGRVSDAARALRTDGFLFPPLGAISLPGLPRIPTSTRTTTSTQQSSSSGSQQQSHGQAPGGFGKSTTSKF